MTLGGQWPEGHVATCHSGVCSVCHETKSLAAPNDWQLDSKGNFDKRSIHNWD